MKNLAALFAAPIAAMLAIALPGAVAAQDYAGGARTVSKTSWVEEWDPAAQRWVRVDDDEAAGDPVDYEVTTVTTTYLASGQVISQTTETRSLQRSLQAPGYPMTKRADAALAQYGPFRVVDAKRAQLLGSTGLSSPKQFDAMLRDFPDLEVLEMVDAPGTSHDISNLAVGRRIRAAGLRTHVPDGGSVRSGAVELFLAGTQRSVADGARFAVHSWLDNHGREPDDFAPDAPENRLYLDYYVEMGMSADRARDFYAMTNSVPHASALWLRAEDMRMWIAPERSERFAAREIRGMAGIQLSVHALSAQKFARALNRRQTLPRLAYGELSGLSIAIGDATRLDSMVAFP